MKTPVYSEHIAALKAQGYTVMRGLVSRQFCTALQHAALTHLNTKIEPVEYEADVQYPGAPARREAAGGHTVRRLLDAYGRGSLFRECATLPQIVRWMQHYFGTPVTLVRSHHNCIMSKHPIYGSLTGWHQDKRYWSFSQDNLVSAWIALGHENARNGGLSFIPGSHTLEFSPECFDQAQFFQADPLTHPDQAALLRTAITPELNQGDVVFFHCKTLHHANFNLTHTVKFSAVFTYHNLHNTPLSGSRSATRPEVRLDFLSDLTQ